MNAHSAASLRRRNPAGCGRRRRGVTLIEVLVSVLVITVGLLGAAAMQAVMLRDNQGSYEYTQTSILTQSILDAMRANPAGVTGGAYDTAGYVCNAPNGAALAARDLARWITTLQSQLGCSACGSVSCAAAACTVRVRWDDSRATGGSAAHVVEMAAQL